MNKSDLINEVSNYVKRKSDAQVVVDCVFLKIKEALLKDEHVTLTGFGTFRMSERSARKGRNPRTGEEIEIGQRKMPRFVPARAFREALK